MSSSQRWLLIAVVVLLGLGEWAWNTRSMMSSITRIEHAAVVRQQLKPPLSVAKAHQFTREETYAFLAAAKRAEAISDPLQRCLAYPDPPGSHWAPDAVRAYCHYRLRPSLSFAQVQSLIQTGHAAELDRRLEAALHAQQTEVDSRGLLDRIYQQNFENASFDIRPTLDAWTRDSPNSAFAWAASGVAYVAMAGAARGEDYMRDTPQSSVDAMDRLLSQADADLRRAIALNPQVTPAHVSLIHAAGLGSGRHRVDEAIRRAIAAVPNDYSVYTNAMWTRQPKWGGSLDDMTQLAEQAQARAGANPLMKLLLAEPPFYKVYNCACEQDVALAAYPAALDQLASGSDLMNAGYAANGSKRPAISAIYLSEALRFEPELDDVRIRRTYSLVEFDEAAWALADAKRAVAASPRDADALRARAHAYESVSDYAHAEQDFRAVIALDPDDTWSLTQLGDLLVNMSHEWDKGWDVADQLIHKQPQNPYGWMLRAAIQEQQPRAGLKDTVEYFEAHFGSNPGLAAVAQRMRSALILQTHSGSHVVTGKNQPPQ